MKTLFIVSNVEITDEGALGTDGEGWTFSSSLDLSSECRISFFSPVNLLMLVTQAWVKKSPSVFVFALRSNQNALVAGIIRVPKQKSCARDVRMLPSPFELFSINNSISAP